MTQAIGYSLAAIGSFAIGALHDDRVTVMPPPSVSARLQTGGLLAACSGG